MDRNRAIAGNTLEVLEGRRSELLRAIAQKERRLSELAEQSRAVFGGDSPQRLDEDRRRARRYFRIAFVAGLCFSSFWGLLVLALTSGARHAG